MGNVIGWYDTNRSDDSENMEQNISEYDDGMVKDANMTRETTKQNYKHFEQIIEENINYSILTKVEENLDISEKVSLVFLLCDSSDLALELIHNIITGDRKSVNTTAVSDWAQRNPPKWRGKLIEALSIIQNYNELISLGFNKSDVDMHLLPYVKNTSIYINKFRKILFKFCESFTQEECTKLIDLIKVDGAAPHNCYNDVYLEVHLLLLVKYGYISIDDKKSPNLEFLIAKLKQLDYLDKVNEIMHLDKVNEIMHLDKVNEMFEKLEYEKIYNIVDPTDVGVCMIINQRDFHLDRRRQFCDKAKEFEKREGTDVDCKSLRETFKNFNVSVHVSENVIHDKMKSEVITTVQKSFKETHSMFFLCILSHGDEGAIYGSNGMTVKIESIVEWLTVDLHTKLKGKPKVVIMQACQGTYVQVVNDDIRTDSPHPKQHNDISSPKLFDDEISAKLCDVLVCYAVVPGYVALRDKNNGSIYIQSVCEQLKKLGKKKDFMSIMTEVNYDVNMKYHPKHGVMTPRFDVRLRKKLYLFPVSGST